MPTSQSDRLTFPAAHTFAPQIPAVRGPNMYLPEDALDSRPAHDTAPPRRTKWTVLRAAQLATLVAQGHDVVYIAEHPHINTSPTNVYRQAARLGLKFRERYSYVLPHTAEETFERAARQREISVVRLIDSILAILGDDPILLDNVLDDEMDTVQSVETI